MTTADRSAPNAIEVAKPATKKMTSKPREMVERGKSMIFKDRPTDPDAIAIGQRTRQITRLIRRMPRRRETLPQVASYQAVLARCKEMLERDGEAAYGPVRAILDGKYAALVAKHG